MNLLKFRRLPKVGIMLAVLAGCASPTVQLYTIAVEPGPTVIGSPKTIALHDISLAGYLDRSGIVRSADDYSLRVMPNDTWGEPLAEMIGRVLTVELAERLPGSNVYSERGAISPVADATA